MSAGDFAVDFDPHGSGRADSPSRIETIEVCRGVAATLVVLAHATGFTTIGGGNALGGLFRFGNVGVDFFFALSGFIIFWVHKGDLGRPERFKRYAWRRLVRIYPLYFVLTVASLLLIAILPFYRAETTFSLWYFVCNFFLIPTGQYPVISPAWTLSHEIVFYAIFGIAILHFRTGMTLMTAWMLAVIFTRIQSIEVQGWSFALFHWVNILFAFGLAAAFLVPKVKKGGLAIFVVGLCIFTVAGASYSFDIAPMTNETLRRLIYGVASLLMILGLVVWEREAQFRVPRWAMTWGAASYAIYLVHYPVLELLSHIRVKLGLMSWIYNEPYLLIQVAVALYCGLLVHWHIEKPITAWIKESRIHIRLESQRRMAT